MSFDLEIIDNDLKILPNGAIRTVTDTPKLRQDIIKIILTPIGSMKAHPWYGCSMADYIGQNLPKHILDSHIKDSISESLQRLQTLQRAQSATQRVSLAELIDIVAEVHLERDIDDLRRINVTVTVLSKRLTKIEEVFTLIS